jgi:exodeoxyribonuclease III
VGDLQDLLRKEQPDVLGIIEHKLQENDNDTRKALEEAFPDYSVAAVNCSTAKKGYSGTAILLRRGGSQQPLKVEAGDMPSAAQEGRLVTVEFQDLFVVLCYVPNSGEGLKRLPERIDQWDAELRAKLITLKEKKATVLIGDLNVAHLDLDIWNVEAPHVPKSAGTTPEERESFSSLLKAGFVDGFRHVHPEAFGAFTYWSVRAGNRPKNRGLRLDYALCSEGMVSSPSCETCEAARAVTLVDAFHMPELCPGDHCPVGAVIALPITTAPEGVS